MWPRLSSIVVATIVGCSQASQMPSDSGIASSAAAARDQVVRVEVAVDSASIAAKGRLAVTVKVTNAGTVPLALSFSSGCRTDYELLDANGAVIGRSGMMCTEATSEQSLAPGASFTDTHIWVRGLRGMPQPAAGSTNMRLRAVLLATNVGNVAPSNTVSVTLH